MRRFVLVFSVAVLLLAAALPVRGQNSQDEILSIPDYGLLKSRNYAGYIPLQGNRQAYWWFVESERSPSADPVVLWLNGGPGCSSLLGLMTENGPYLIRHTGAFFNNSFGWTQQANILYLESPPGVGFSTDTPNMSTVWNDTFVAQLSYEFLLKWYAKFPTFAGNDFYIAGESYAGHYVPQLAEQILDGKDAAMKGRMRGFMVGNPCTGDPVGDGLDWCFVNVDPTLNQYLANHAFMSFDPRIQTANFTNFDPYDILVRNCESDFLAETIRWDHPVVRSYRERKVKEDEHYRQMGAVPPTYGPCNNNYMQDYLSRADVAAAIHANHVPNWQSCSPTINYPTPTTMPGVLPLYNRFFNETTWDIMFFSGDADTIVNFIQTEKIIISLNRSVKSNFSPWSYPDEFNATWTQLGGWYVKYDRVSWASVKGAGHMVAMYKPAEGYELFKSFVETGGPGRM